MDLQNDNEWRNIDLEAFIPLNAAIYEDIINGEQFDDLYESGSEYENSSESEYEVEQKGPILYDSVEDSHEILPKIFFKKYYDIDANYVTLYKIMDEIDLLLKAMKRRANHPFTAHLTEETGSLEQVQDDTSRGLPDILHDSDDDRQQRPKLVGNEGLTKKRYCKSTKFFNALFDNGHRFRKIHQKIRLLRHYSFKASFHLFSRSLPPDIFERLPTEVWVKIWTYTHFPLAMNYDFKNPWRAETTWHQRLEVCRLSQVFRSAAKIHKVLFEIMFSELSVLSRNDDIMMDEDLYEMKLSRLALRSIFDDAMTHLESSFARLTVTNRISGFLKFDESGEVQDQFLEDIGKVTLIDRLRRGLWTVPCLQVDESKLGKITYNDGVHFEIDDLHSNSFLLVHCSHCNHRLIANIIEVENLFSGRVSCRLSLDLTINLAMHLKRNIRRPSFSLSRSYLIFYQDSSTLDYPEEEISTYIRGCPIYLWRVPSGQQRFEDPVQYTRDDAEVHFLSLFPSQGFSLSVQQSTLTDGREIVLGIMEPSRNSAESGIVITAYEPSTKKTLFTKEHQGLAPGTQSLKGSACLLRFKDSVCLMSLETGKILEKFDKKIMQSQSKHVSKDYSSSGGSIYAKFDANPNRDQFVVFTKYLLQFEVRSYDSLNMTTRSQILFRGSKFCHDLRGLSCESCTKLVDGVLFCLPALQYADACKPTSYKEATFKAFDLKTDPVSMSVLEVADHSTDWSISNILVLNDSQIIYIKDHKTFVSFDFTQSISQIDDFESNRLTSALHAEEERLAQFDGLVLNGVYYETAKGIGVLKPDSNNKAVGDITIKLADFPKLNSELVSDCTALRYELHFDKDLKVLYPRNITFIEALKETN